MAKFYCTFLGDKYPEDTGCIIEAETRSDAARKYGEQFLERHERELVVLVCAVDSGLEFRVRRLESIEVTNILAQEARS